MQELSFLSFTCCLLFIDIDIKFPEDILNDFQVIEWTPQFFYDGQS